MAPSKAGRAPYKKPNSLASFREDMIKTYGEQRVSRRDQVKPYDVIPTGSLSLDYALRVGGWVRGRCSEIVGIEGVGKTTLAISSMASAQKVCPDLAVGYIDMEQTFDWDWAETNGLDTSDEKFFHVYPDNSEDVSDQISSMCRSGLFSLIVVDSIGGMESKRAFDKQAEEDIMGKNAQVITRMVKKIAPVIRQENVGVIFINQYRANLSGMGGDISAGPKALKYATSAKVEMRNTGETPLYITENSDKVAVGRLIAARVSRLKVGAPGKKAEFWIINQLTEEYGPIGIDRADEAVTIGKLSGVIQGTSWLTLPNGEKFQGAAKVKDYLRANPDIMESIRVAAVETLSDSIIPNIETSFEEEDND